MALFPMFVDISGRKCVVVGGGRVALRKVKTLLRYGGDVRVISKEICPEILALLPGTSCLLMNRTEEGCSGSGLSPELETLIEESVLAVAASGDRQLNHQVAVFCGSRGIPVNVIDAPEECSFQFPSVVKRGEISVGINSGTNSPALTRLIRRKMEEDLPDYYGDLAEQLGELKDRIKAAFPEEKKRREILTTAAKEAFCRGRLLTEEELEDLVSPEKNAKTKAGGTGLRKSDIMNITD